MWTRRSFILFMLAAALGATLRWLLSVAFAAYGNAELIPWAVFCANMLGCFGFGLAWVYVQHKKLDSRALLVGFMGSLTTFSSYAYDIYVFIIEKAWMDLALYGLGQLVLAVLLLHLGIVGMQRYLQS